MITTGNNTKIKAFALSTALAAAASGIAVPLAAMILAAPANAGTNIAAFEPPDPCLTATSCPNHRGGIALNPQPLPPGYALNPQPGAPQPGPDPGPIYDDKTPPPPPHGVLQVGEI